MKAVFPYNQDLFPPIEIFDENLIGIFKPKKFDEVKDAFACISNSINNPIGSESLESIAKGKRSALIISDDNTRQTPVQIIIPIIEEKLKSAGIESIKILVALGTHRPMTNDELLIKFGTDICSRFQIINHEYKNENQLVTLGSILGDVPFKVNKAVLEADLVIGLGQIVPHRIAGFSGGGKIIVPGVAGAEAIAQTHWIGGLEQGDKMLGFADNPVREEIHRCAEMAGLKFVVNVVCDPDGKLIDCFSGDSKEAYYKGCELAKEVFGVKVPELADIVIIDSYPKDNELWQAAKALYAADLMVKKGGVVILVSPCPEGVSKAHPLIEERGYMPEDKTICDIESGELNNYSVASHCLRMGRLIKDKATGILVSPGISKELTEHLGFIHANTPQEALELAIKICSSSEIGEGRDGVINSPLEKGVRGIDNTIQTTYPRHAELDSASIKISVLQHGGEALPVLKIS